MVLGRSKVYEGGEEDVDTTIEKNDEFNLGDVDPSDEELEKENTEEYDNNLNLREIKEKEKRNVRERIEDEDPNLVKDINEIAERK
jgi:DNA primase large subunit